MASKDDKKPYLTAAKAASGISGAKNVQNTAENNANDANTQIGDKTAQNAKEAYTLYSQARAERPNVSETSKSRLTTAYGRASAANNDTFRNSSAAIENAKNAAINTAKATAYKTAATTTATARKADIARKDKLDKAAKEMKLTKQKNDLAIWKDTIGRYDTRKKAEKAIAKLKKSKDPLKREKIAYIRNQMGKLSDAARDAKDQLKKMNSGGSGGGSGGGGYYRRSYGYGRSYGGGYSRSSGSGVTYTPPKNTSVGKKKSKPKISLPKNPSLPAILKGRVDALKADMKRRRK